jgi:hypothetical protein
MDFPYVLQMNSRGRTTPRAAAGFPGRRRGAMEL